MKIFWSYARLDDKEPKRKVDKLRQEFENVLSQTVGKKSEVFFDTDSLNWGVKWREEIEHSIRECDGFIAIVTPSYFNRRMCIYELQTALEASKKISPCITELARSSRAPSRKMARRQKSTHS